MARSVATIRDAMLADITADATLTSTITSTSGTAVWRLMVYICAVLINLFEQAADLYRTNTDAAIKVKSMRDNKWLRKKVYEYQHGDNLSFNTTTFQIEYPTIDASKKIVKYCAVFNKYGLNSNFGGQPGITVRAAKGATPTVLTSAEMDGLKTYVEHLVQPGVQVVVESDPTMIPEYLIVIADVKYDPRYSSTVKTAVFDAMRAYLTTLDSEDGMFDVDSLFQAMNAVEGVRHITMEEVRYRTSGGGSQLLFKSYPTGSIGGIVGNPYVYTSGGVMIEETAAGSTWTDTITFVPIA